MEEKLNKKVVAISVIAIVAIVISLSLAYFTSIGTGPEQTITTANLTLSFDDGSAIIRNTDIEPIYEEDILTESTMKTFTIQNTSNRNLYMTISLEDIVISEALESSSFHWRLADGSSNTLNEGTFNVQDVQSIDMYSNQLINTSQINTYKLYIWLEETYSNQNTLQGLSFAGKIVVKGYINPTD